MSTKRVSFLAIFIVLVVPALTCAATDSSRHFEKSFPARPGATVVVDVSFHEVEVTARPGATVDFTVDLESGSPRLLDAFAPVFEDTADRITVRSTTKHTSWLENDRIQGRVQVEMPPGMSLLVDSSSGSVKLTGDLGQATARFDTSSGSVSIRGGMSKLEVDTSSGSLHADLTRPLDRLSADTSSGSVTVKGGEIGAAKVDTSSGSVNLAGLTGGANLDTSSGSVAAQWVKAPPAGATVRADTGSGGVRLSFPRGTALAGTVDTGSGGITSDFPGSFNEDHDRLELAGGPDAVRITVDTGSGGVRLIAE